MIRVAFSYSLVLLFAFFTSIITYALPQFDENNLLLVCSLLWQQSWSFKRYLQPIDWARLAQSLVDIVKMPAGRLFTMLRSSENRAQSWYRRQFNWLRDRMSTVQWHISVRRIPSDLGDETDSAHKTSCPGFDTLVFEHESEASDGVLSNFYKLLTCQST